MAPCSVCWDLKEIPESTETTRFTYPELCEFVRKTGCAGCSFLRDAISCYVRECGARMRLPRLSCQGVGSRGLSLHGKNFTLEVYALRGTCILLLLQCSQYIDDHWALSSPPPPLTSTGSKKPSLRTIPLLRNISGDSASQEAFSWALSTLTDCLKHHGACRAGSIEPTLPTRILDLGSGNDDVKLCEPEAKQARYICLSHRWGAYKPLQTTKETYHEFKQHIPFSLFPKTFQDAIIFTRRLKIQYLWIDSLCIIQDDSDDWQRESSQMGSIFQNSYLTLAAATSPDSTGGCFSKASKECVGCRIEGDLSQQEETALYVRRQLPNAKLSIGYRRSEALPLLDRAWVYQERFLASRVLYFGAEELYWECVTEASCECGSLDLEEYSTSKVTHVQALSSNSAEAIHTRWRELVEEYSLKELTYDSDRLPALSGMAKVFQNLGCGRYIAGLWENSLVYDLLWKIPIPAAGRLEKWRAPTWSWASIEGRKASVSTGGSTYYRRIEYKFWEAAGEGIRKYYYGPDDAFGEMKQYCTIQEASVEYAGSDPTGELSAAYLRVSGHLVPVLLTDDYSCVQNPGGGGKEKFHRDYDNLNDELGFYCLKVAGTPRLLWSLVLACLSEELQAFARVGILQEVMDGSDMKLYDEADEERTILIL